MYDEEAEILKGVRAKEADRDKEKKNEGLSGRVHGCEKGTVQQMFLQRA